MKKLIQPMIQTQRGLSLWDLRELARNEPTEFMRKVEEGADSGKLRLSDVRDIRGLWQAMADIPIQVTMPDMSGAMRTITTSAFPIMTGTLVVAQINERYASIPTIGQDLVTEMDDEKKVTTIVGVSTLDDKTEEVKELGEFPEIGASEEKVEIRHRKNGRKLTLSAEAIRENELPNFIMRINDLTDLMSRRIEKLTIRRVTDYDGSQTTPAEPYVYRPAGTGTQLYDENANTPGIRAPDGTCYQSNQLQDETDLDNARERLNGMLDDNGERIGVNKSEISILVPDALVKTVLKILNSEYVPGVENEISNWGPRGRFHIPVEKVYSSPLLDDLSTSAWYYGAFKRQFIRKWKMRMEYVSLGMDTQAYLDAQVAAQYRIAWDVECGARDYCYVLQNLSGTTFPANE